MIGLVISCGDPSVVLDGAEEVFDEMTPSIHSEIARDVPLAIGFGRDDGKNAALVEFAAEPVVVEAFVADQRADFDAIEQRFDADAVVALARQQNEARQIAQRVDQSDDLGRQTAARTPDRLILSPPFCARPVLVDADEFRRSGRIRNRGRRIRAGKAVRRRL